jgi:hypothetical protein
VEEDLRNLGVDNWKTKGTKMRWLEKGFRAGQNPHRVVVPIIIII